jgi:hsp70-interacting protein
MDESKMAFLQSLLRYSTSHTTTESSGETSHAASTTDNESTNREMSPERRKWLENALNSMTINPIDEMKKCLSYLETNNNEKDNEQKIEKKLEALETLKDWCEDINFAIDFHKLNGYKLLPDLLNDSNSDIRALACELIGTCAQNNPYCQETLLSTKILPLMFFKLDKDVDDVKIKALFAISCLTRDYEPGQQKLLEGNSLDILIRSLKSPVEKLQIKCCFLCSSICNNKLIKDELTKKKLIETLIDMYRQPDSNIHEHVLSAINVMIDDNPVAIEQARQMKEINFKQILSQRIELIRNDPPCDVLFLFNLFF